MAASNSLMLQRATAREEKREKQRKRRGEGGKVPCV